jgi:predicted methyltransferase
MPVTHRAPLVALVCLLVASQVPALARADIYDAAVAQPGRSAADRQRDAIDHPAEVLRVARIRAGMHVADILGAGGYYSELLSPIVGPQGHVLLINNKAYENWSTEDGGWARRLADGRLPNVEHRTAELEHLELGTNTLDAILLIKVYHDFYWVQPNSEWPPIDVPTVLDEITRALKPGGLLLLVDHAAVAGSGARDAGTLHRIDEQYARHEFESRGFKVVASSDVLRHPEDARDLITYKGPMVGKTDRFVLVFRKSGGRSGL